ncbi:MAG: signal peptidase II [Spirochaetota bacterium]
MRQSIIRVIFIILIAAVVIGCDQSTKFMARKTLKNLGTVKVVDDIFILRYVENNGAFLSFGSNWSPRLRYFVFILFPILLLSIFIIYILKSKKANIWQIIAFAFITGGGISNLIDRIIFNGYVTDFMNLGVATMRTGIFNCADLFILAGIIIILIMSKEIFWKRKK